MDVVLRDEAAGGGVRFDTCALHEEVYINEYSYFRHILVTYIY